MNNRKLALLGITLSLSVCALFPAYNMTPAEKQEKLVNIDVMLSQLQTLNKQPIFTYQQLDTVKDIKNIKNDIQVLIEMMQNKLMKKKEKILKSLQE